MQNVIHNRTTLAAVSANQPAVPTLCKAATTSTTSKCQPGISACWNDRYHAEAVHAESKAAQSTSCSIIKASHAVASIAALIALEFMDNCFSTAFMHTTCHKTKYIQCMQQM